MTKEAFSENALSFSHETESIEIPEASTNSTQQLVVTPKSHAQQSSSNSQRMRIKDYRLKVHGPRKDCIVLMSK
jgi:hypothetical protein